MIQNSLLIYWRPVYSSVHIPSSTIKINSFKILTLTKLVERMNKKLIAEINTCPFCHSKLVKSPSRCFSCGGERIYGYIPPTQRKIIILLRIILIAITLFYFFRLLPVYNDHVILIPLFITSLFLSFFIPSTYYIIKYRNNVIWKKKPLLW
jgi:hypothetical protein